MATGEADVSPETGSSIEVLLPNDGTAPRSARQAVIAALAQWQLLDLGDVCVLVASELVTNALLHGDAPLLMSLRYWDHRLRLDITDGDSRPLSVGSMPECDAESGRGLLLVHHLADDFGSDLTPGEGKTVHAEWRTDVTPGA
jgi:anti-sigma regulatory factor (Ser/Thr protein kinase)